MTLTPDQQAEIAASRASTAQTRRPVSPGMEARLYTAHPVLDHGFVRVIDYMGDDSAIVQAARVSYGAGTKQVSDDAGLIRYLMRHWHSTPFEMCEVKFHVKLPIFVARQWIRHRTANVNEYSARYSILEREFYVPSPEHLAAQSSVNNQGRGAVLEGAEAARVLDLLREDATRAYDHYEAMLSQEGQQGLARELARMNLPASVYTQWYWKCDLHNLFHFLRLRADAHAQYEIRAYAGVMAQITADWVPLAWAAFEDYRMGGVQVSAKGVEVLKRRLAGEAVMQETSGDEQGRVAGVCGGVGVRFGEKTLPDDATFDTHDRFDRGLLSRGLMRLIASAETPLVIALDGRWGAGKTFFLKLWQRELGAKGYATIYLNAFQEDYSSDAFGAIASSILRAYEAFDVNDPGERRSFRRKAANVARIIARGVASAAVKGVTAGMIERDNFESVADAVISEMGDQAIAQIEAHLEAKTKEAETLASFRASLQELPILISRQGGGRKPQLIFILDELDRCRPNFALDLLEAVKHFFNAENVHFVIGANLDALSQSVDKTYGYEHRGREYLARMLPFVVKFDEGRPREFRQRLIDYLVSEWTLLGIPQTHNDKQEGLITVIADLAIRRGLTLREVERVMQNLALVLTYLDARTLAIPPILAALILVRNHDLDLFGRIKRGDVELNELRDWLGLREKEDSNDQPLIWLNAWLNASLKEGDLSETEKEMMRNVQFNYNIGERRDLLKVLARDVVDRVWLA